MVEVVGQYTQLRKAGANYTGRCPFHEEKTPSFSVNPTEKLFYCFGCGAGGNLFGFVQQKENLDFAAAVEHLADKYGVVLEYEESSARGEAERHRRERLRALLEQATGYYERVLAEAKAAAPAREYLAQRGMADGVCREFRLGFSLPGWDKLRDAALARGFNEEELLEAGLVIPGKRGRPYDRFRGRIMFPLADDRGRTVGFGARSLGDDKPKYLNSPETPLYHKSEALFGLDKAKAAAGKEDRVYVVEGYTDVMALAQAGVRNVVASMGTALTEQQLKRLSRGVTSNIYLCFDADAAGGGATQRGLAMARQMGLVLHVVSIPDGLDPADYVLSGAGAEGFRRLADEALTRLQFRVRSTLASHDLGRPEGRARAFAQIREVLVDAATPIEYDEELRFIGEQLGLTRDNLASLIEGRVARRPVGERAGAGQRRVDAMAPPMPRHDLEVRFLAGCLALPDKGRDVLAGLDAGYFATAETRRAFRTVQQRLECAGAGNILQTADKRGSENDAPGVDELLAEIFVRVGRERFSAAVVDELFLRLQEAQVSRLIARLKTAVGADDTGKKGEKLAQLESVRRRLQEAIRAIPVDEEPEKG
jgi:DNA primase